MLFTPLHQALGRTPGPIDDEFLDAAVEAEIAESAGIDWKRVAPEVKNLTGGEFPKDVAAMANSGGGVIVFGIDETQKAAKDRVDVGDLDQERYERALRSAAVTAISPPVFGLDVAFLGEEGKRAVAVIVPASVDGPHLIYRNEYFGAPVRNDADTVWMKEREIERMYRARFDEQRHIHEALDALYDEALARCPSGERAWFVSVARPRIPARSMGRMGQDRARSIFWQSTLCAARYGSASLLHPIESVGWRNPRPGLRRWIAVDTVEEPDNRWKSATASSHFDGSVTFAAALGGAPNATAKDPGGRVNVSRLECAVVDFMALVRAAAEELGIGEVEVRVGVEYPDKPIEFMDDGAHWRDDEALSRVPRFEPVSLTVRADVDETDYVGQVRDIALDVVNQAGAPETRHLAKAT